MGRLSVGFDSMLQYYLQGSELRSGQPLNVGSSNDQKLIGSLLSNRRKITLEGKLISHPYDQEDSKSA